MQCDGVGPIRNLYNKGVDVDQHPRKQCPWSVHFTHGNPIVVVVHNRFGLLCLLAVMYRVVVPIRL